MGVIQNVMRLSVRLVRSFLVWGKEFGAKNSRLSVFPHRRVESGALMGTTFLTIAEITPATATERLKRPKPDARNASLVL